MSQPTFSNPQSGSQLYSMEGEPVPQTGGGGGDIYAALINLGSTIYASETARNNSKRTIKANKELAEYAYNMDLDMWNRMNNYNDPAAQMARYEAAGLNPNLIYGNGSASSGNASSMPKYNAPTVDYSYTPPNIGAVLGQYQDYRMKQAQIDNVKAQTENTRSRTITEAARSVLVGTQGEQAEQNLNYGAQVKPFQASIVESESRAAGAKAQGEFQKLLLMNQQEQMNILRMSYLQNNISQQGVDMERKQAQLMWENQKAEWAKMGVTSGDNPVLRILVRMLNESGLTK